MQARRLPSTAAAAASPVSVAARRIAAGHSYGTASSHRCTSLWSVRASQAALARTGAAQVIARRYFAFSASSASSTSSSTPHGGPAPGASGNSSSGNGGGGGDGRGEGGSGSTFEAYRAYRRERNARQERQFMTLAMYLARMPPGFRELLLWSPLLGMLYFMCWQARPYYLEAEEPWYYVAMPQRWRRRPDATSMLQRAPKATAAEGTQGGAAAVSMTTQRREVHATTAMPTKTVATADSTAGTPPAPTTAAASAATTTTTITLTTHRFRAAGVTDAADAAVPSSSPIAPFHEVTLRQRELACPGEEPPPASLVEQRYAYGVWRGPLEVVRDPATRRVIGYRTAAPVTASPA